ncbi:UNKNOWN [Stylonychia lemnae]|uniref:Protein kinase domain-containing protein n=1 Tax=Stylonychia lemnae TaxID=5949 RepID=A0A078BBD9_STYLE|nr:UNKNOWN [Stylonychia lemnae]|eukprot:CDW90577.1 UNKNOWN [Stylonychia lemnae]
MLKNAKGSLSEEDCRLILKQLVKGLRDLFDYDLVHRDIKLANILLHFNIPDQLKISGDRYITQDDFLTMDQKDKLNFLKMVDLQSVNFQVKIADFGFSKFLDTKSQRSDTMCGTPLYMAPQLVEDIKYTYKADIWSLGVIFFELLTGSHPFNGRNLEQLGKNLNQGEYALEVVHKPSVECLRIITGCLQYDEDERSNIIDISNSEYFTERYAPREIPNSFFVNRKGSNTLRNSSADIYQRKSSLNQNNNGKYKMILNSKDSWLLRRLEMSMTTLTPSPKFSEIQQVERKQQNNFKTLQINTSSPNEFNCELAPQLITPFQKIKSPKIENFVLTEGQILEASQYLIARDNEFTKITSSKVLMEDYFSFQ